MTASECVHGVPASPRQGLVNWCPDCEQAGYVVLPHEHDVSCAFGNPTCPAFGEAPPPRRSWWRRLLGVGGL